MDLHIHTNADAANEAAANLLAGWLAGNAVRTLMVAGGNTPLELYRRVAARRLPLAHLIVFALDEYVDVPPDEPRNCANLLRDTVANAWGIPAKQYFALSSLERDALESVRTHERRIADAGGIDAIVLGLGQNGHLGFNEPGSPPDSAGRVLDLESSSIEANRKWFRGEHAPARGVTVGLKTILAARRVLILAYGPHKTAAVKAMVEDPIHDGFPASLLQAHAKVHLFLDQPAAAGLSRSA